MGLAVRLVAAGLISLAGLAAPALADPAAPPAALEQVETDAHRDELGRLQDRVDELEGRLYQAEERLRQLDEQRALVPSNEAPQGPGGVVIQAGESRPEAVSFAGPLDIHGQVTGSAVAFGGDIRVHNGALVMGDAVSFGGQVLVDEGGAVEGNRVTLGEVASGSLVGARSEQRPDWVRSLARRLVVLLSFAGAGVLVVGLFPRQVDTVARTISSHPVRSGLLGVLLSGLSVILAALLAITLVGIPVSMFIATVVALAWLLGFIGLCQAAGDLLPLNNSGARRWLAFLLGVFLLSVVSSLPAVGKLVLGALSLVCVGAALHTRLGNRELLD